MSDDPVADFFLGSTGITHAADADHVAALLVERILVEEVVANVLKNVLDLRTGEFKPIGIGIVHGGLVIEIIDRDVLARQHRGSPPETRD